MTIEVYRIFPTSIMSNQFYREFTVEELDIINSHRSNVRKTSDIPTANETSIDCNVLDNPDLSEIREFIQNTIQAYVDNIESPKDKFETYITQSLVNFTENGQEHQAHIHPNSFISGVLYIHAKQDIDRIVFYDNNVCRSQRFPTFDREYNDYNSSTWWFPVWTGRLVLFPSNLRHCVEQTKSDYTRISLVFNTFIRGSVGSTAGYDFLTFR